MKSWLIDTAERTIATYAQAFVGLLIARPAFDVNWGTLKCLAVAALPAGLAVVKAALASRVRAISPASLAPAESVTTGC